MMTTVNGIVSPIVVVVNEVFNSTSPQLVSQSGVDCMTRYRLNQFKSI
jgi:hypothetical protein